MTSCAGRSRNLRKGLHFEQLVAIYNWIQEKTGIEAASKVRSTQGLLVHVFGRLAAAMFLLNVLPQSA